MMSIHAWIRVVRLPKLPQPQHERLALHIHYCRRGSLSFAGEGNVSPFGQLCMIQPSPDRDPTRKPDPIVVRSAISRLWLLLA